MVQKIGAFLAITNPIVRGDMIDECFAMAKDCFDTVTIIDGEETWPKEFSWPLIGEHFQKGYEQTDADFVFHLDCDFFFHEKDFESIRSACEKHKDAPALSFYKYQFVLPHKYNLKSRLVLAVNKAKYGDRIRFDSGGDLAQPSLDGKYLTPDDVPASEIAFYNYDFMAKSKAQVIDDVGRMDRAYQRHFGKWLYSKDGTEESAYEGWLEMMTGRYAKPQKTVSLNDHPKYVRETILNLTPDQFGYNGFGLDKSGYVVST